MRKIVSIIALTVMVLTASAVRADIIHLKDGSLLKGKVTSFSEGQFVVTLYSSTGRTMGRATIDINDVARIEFDSAPGPANSGASLQSSETVARDSSQTVQPESSLQRSTPPAESAPRETVPADPPPTPVKEPEPTEKAPAEKTATEKPATEKPAPNTQTVVETPEAEPKSRKPSAQAKVTAVDVFAQRDWTSTGLIVKRGDRIRITAAGTVTLNPETGQTSGPEGINSPDSNKLMVDQPTGALIAVIGADNNDFIFIGRTAEFSATNDGLLFLSVNEGALANNTGSFKASIEVEPRRR